MKLLLCMNCVDIFSLDETENRTCKCGKVGGRYIDDLNAVYFGADAVPLGFDNSSLVHAIFNRPRKKPGRRFDAFVIEKGCATYKRVSKKSIEKLKTT